MIRALAALILLTGPALADPATLIGALTLRHDAPWFGGFSGIEMAPDGSAAVLISDRGDWAKVALTRRDGALVAAHGWRSKPIAGTNGRPMPAAKVDSEGLTRRPDGTLCISFEMTPRINCYDAVGGAAQSVPMPKAFDNLPRNGGLESLASDSRGHLYTMPEKATAPDGSIPVYRFADGTWSTVFNLPAQGSFRPVDADIHDGQLYVLLRSFALVGFASRLIRVPLAGGTAQTLFNSGIGTHDNLEGLSVWRNAQGDLVASMVSDDNQKWFQRSEIVEYRLTEPPVGAQARAPAQRNVPLAPRHNRH